MQMAFLAFVSITESILQEFAASHYVDAAALARQADWQSTPELLVSVYSMSSSKLSTCCSNNNSKDKHEQTADLG